MNIAILKQSIRKEQWVMVTTDMVPLIQPWYYISNFGRIYSIKSNKFLTPTYDKNGYLMVCLYRRYGAGINVFVHRLVAMAFVVNFDKCRDQVNHKNGIKDCNDSYNLEWCTNKENVRHSYNTGLRSYNNNFLKGENNISAKISYDIAENIAYDLSLGIYTQNYIAEKYNTTESIVGNIACGYTWKELYIKYDLKNTKRTNRLFSNDQLHSICKFFELNKGKFNTLKELYIEALAFIGIKYESHMHETMNRIYYKKRFNEITNLYDY